MKKWIIVLIALGVSCPAFAQVRKPPINLDPLNLIPDRPAASGSPAANLLGALDDKLLPDLIYAKKLADASGNKVTAPCYQTWIDIIQKRKTAVTNPDGTPLELPQPRLVTDFEKAVELRNALQPDSEFMLACSPVANMIKQDVIKFIGIILGGGVSLAALGL